MPHAVRGANVPLIGTNRRALYPSRQPQRFDRSARVTLGHDAWQYILPQNQLLDLKVRKIKIKIEKKLRFSPFNLG